MSADRADTPLSGRESVVNVALPLRRDGGASREPVGVAEVEVAVVGPQAPGDESGGGEDQTMSSSQVDARAVYRLRDGDWKKDKKLLESLR